MNGLVVRGAGAGLAFALVVLVLLGALSWRSLSLLLEAEERVVHSHAIIAGSESLLSALSEAEAGYRGFVITGERRYLEPLDGAARALDQEFLELAKMTTQSPRQQQRLETLRPLIAVRLEGLREKSRPRSPKGGEEAASAAILKGLALGDNIRLVVRDLQKEEEALLESNALLVGALARRTRIAAVAGSAAAIVFLLLAGLAGSREQRPGRNERRPARVHAVVPLNRAAEGTPPRAEGASLPSESVPAASAPAQAEESAPRVEDGERGGAACETPPEADESAPPESTPAPEESAVVEEPSQAERAQDAAGETPAQPERATRDAGEEERGEQEGASQAPGEEAAPGEPESPPAATGEEPEGPEDGRAQAGEERAPSRGDGSLVLVCDSEPEHLNFFRELLQRCGYRVTTAANGRECLAKSGALGPRAVVLASDAQGGGRQAVRALHENRRTRNIPIIIAGAPGTEEEWKELKAAAWVERPEDPSSLEAAAAIEGLMLAHLDRLVLQQPSGRADERKGRSAGGS